jgi:hypothetical protein
VTKRARKPDPRQMLFSWSPDCTISARESARILDVSIKTICRMVADGTLAARKNDPEKINSPWRVNYESVILHVERIHEEAGLEKRF